MTAHDPPIDADLLEYAYRQGAFPMAHGTDDLSVDWYAPDPRAVIPLEPQGFHIRRSLAKQIRRKPFEIRVDTQFEAVIRACAKPRPGEGGDVWLSEMLISAYVDLAKRGHAHSIEAWHDNTWSAEFTAFALAVFFVASPCSLAPRTPRNSAWSTL